MADRLSRSIAATKRRLLAGGLLEEIEWGIPTGEPDVRGRQTITWTMLDALIEHRPALQRESGFTTDRADNTVLVILEPVAITDDHTFRWGDPVHVYSVKKVDGLLQDEDTGVRLSSSDGAAIMRLTNKQSKGVDTHIIKAVEVLGPTSNRERYGSSCERTGKPNI